MTNEKILNLDLVHTENHSYLKVDKQTFYQFNLNGSEFSRYSYYQPSNNHFYLEEDCDAWKFYRIAKEAGYQVNFNHKHIKKINLGKVAA